MIKSPLDLAIRYDGIHEVPGGGDHPLIQWWLSLCGFGTDSHDEIPWCSAFVNGIAWECRLARSKSAMARSWLRCGIPVPRYAAAPGFDVVILKRGDNAPGPDVIDAPGHVGFFAGWEGDTLVHVHGGNQGNAVNTSSFPVASILGLRRLTVG